ncbi:oxidoreductase [Streptomyces sp. YC504]|uniref:Oxidoreductase n=1 Tax=Streptomyces mesophilus TaxID=1775132 RepID=A0A6G4XJT4_9ACTN|nr:PDR/VanB family oxidoreductase [Streptomyces mesophilus]NGO77805.1 oxidoreductase [Streptomyces mesophilus]
MNNPVPLNDHAPIRQLVVVDARREAEGVLALTLADPAGAPLPAWEPGAHVDVVLPSGLVRSYSLCGSPRDRGAYRIAVLLTPDSRGGSAELHRVGVVGQDVSVRGPRNHFPLVSAPAYLFLAGGIGITPLLPMLRQLAADPAAPRWSLLYGGRSLSSMAFRDELAALPGGEVTLWPQDTHGLPDPDRLLADLPASAAVYCCGPEGLLQAVQTSAERRLPSGALHTERFRAPAEEGPVTGGAFEVELRRTGVSLRVPVDRTLLDVVREAVPGVPFSCEEGMCGTCETKVLDGTPDHRDMLLSDAERAAGSTMMICVGRSVTPRLALDL